MRKLHISQQGASWGPGNHSACSLLLPRSWCTSLWDMQFPHGHGFFLYYPTAKTQFTPWLVYHEVFKHLMFLFVRNTGRGIKLRTYACWKSHIFRLVVWLGTESIRTPASGSLALSMHCVWNSDVSTKAWVFWPKPCTKLKNVCFPQEHGFFLYFLESIFVVWQTSLPVPLLPY